MTMKRQTPPLRRTRRGERGIALVFVTFAIAALLVAVSGALVTGAANSRATTNYRAASDVHFVAESGISHAIQNINATGTVHFKNEIVDDWSNRFGTDAKTGPSANYTYTVAAVQNNVNPKG